MVLAAKLNFTFTRNDLVAFVNSLCHEGLPTEDNCAGHKTCRRELAKQFTASDIHYGIAEVAIRSGKQRKFRRYNKDRNGKLIDKTADKTFEDAMMCFGIPNDKDKNGNLIDWMAMQPQVLAFFEERMKNLYDTPFSLSLRRDRKPTPGGENSHCHIEVDGVRKATGGNRPKTPCANRRRDRIMKAIENARKVFRGKQDDLMN